jgi:hypothetical protein
MEAGSFVEVGAPGTKNAKSASLYHQQGFRNFSSQKHRHSKNK